MRGHVSNHAATMGEVLRESGYTTLAIGKWHLTSMENASSAGRSINGRCNEVRPFTVSWTEKRQFSPDLVYDNHRVEQPRVRRRVITERGPRRSRD